MRLRLLYAVALILFVTDTVGKLIIYKSWEDYENRQLKPQRQPLPITNLEIQELPPYKKVRVATVHYEYTQKDPNQVKEVNAELAGVQHLFGSLYHFQIFDFSIPRTNSADAQAYLEQKMASLYQDLSSPDDLVIIWYGGHGGTGGTWTLRISPSEVVRVDWRTIDSNVIAPTGVDTLQIIDSCHAEGFLDDETLRGVSAPAEWNGRGAFSVISAATGDNSAGICQHAFSKAVLFTLQPKNEADEPYHFVPSSLYYAIPVPGMEYATLTGNPEIIKASIKEWYGHSFFELATPEGQVQRRKIAPLTCG